MGTNDNTLDPTRVRLSPHFLLSDFAGNHTVFTKGFANLLDPQDPDLPTKLRNARALCREFLEPFLEQAGPLSIAYGYITPELSRAIIRYQDPDKPSHHRWDLGAACDIVAHEWTNADPDDDTIESAPIALAHEIDQSGYPYSRLITYSESPYLCIAVSADEVRKGSIRRAFYENRYTGQPKVKPDYRQYATPGAKMTAKRVLEAEGLAFGWRGAGYPTHHGGGRRQMQHVRLSRYTMLSDFLFNLQLISNGEKNVPNVQDQDLMDAFYNAGDAYDALIDATGINRFSIIEGFVSHTSSQFIPEEDWRSGHGSFIIVPPATHTPQNILNSLAKTGEDANIEPIGDDALLVKF